MVAEAEGRVGSTRRRRGRPCLTGQQINRGDVAASSVDVRVVGCGSGADEL
jgi:hypothetical protein